MRPYVLAGVLCEDLPSSRSNYSISTIIKTVKKINTHNIHQRIFCNVIFKHFARKSNFTCYIRFVFFSFIVKRSFAVADISKGKQMRRTRNPQTLHAMRRSASSIVAQLSEHRGPWQTCENFSFVDVLVTSNKHVHKQATVDVIRACGFLVVAAFQNGSGCIQHGVTIIRKSYESLLHLDPDGRSNRN